jgi:hypothetical protein
MIFWKDGSLPRVSRAASVGADDDFNFYKFHLWSLVHIYRAVDAFWKWSHGDLKSSAFESELNGYILAGLFSEWLGCGMVMSEMGFIGICRPLHLLLLSQATFCASFINFWLQFFAGQIIGCHAPPPPPLHVHPRDLFGSRVWHLEYAGPHQRGA